MNDEQVGKLIAIGRAFLHLPILTEKDRAPLINVCQSQSGGMDELLDDLLISARYVLFDLEATKREREFIRQEYVKIKSKKGSE